MSVAKPEFSLEELIEEAERELKMREKVYPRWIQYGKINEKTAERRLNRQKGIVNILKKLKDKQGKQISMFNMG